LVTTKKEDVMRKKLFHIIKSLLLAGLILNFVAACGGSSSSTVQTVSGTASGGAALTGNITLKDAKGAVKTVAIGNGGAYSIPVDGLSAPFLISAGSYFSLATAPGVTNVGSSAEFVGDYRFGQLPKCMI